MTRNLLCGLYLLMAALAGFAQGDLLPVNARPFPLQVIEAIAGLERNQRPPITEIAQRVQALWEGNRFTSMQMDTLERVVGVLLGGQYRVLPDMANYLLVVEFIVQHADAERLFQCWHTALAHSIQGHIPTRTSRFMQQSRDLFIDNVLFHSPAIRWVARNGNLVYDFTNNESVVHVSGTDLVGLAFGDSIAILQTSGHFDLQKGNWSGKGGRLTWQRVLLNPQEVFAELSNYEIDFARTIFEADSVLFHHTQIFPVPVMGRVKDRVQSDIQPGQAIFPVFYSDQHRHELQNIFPAVHFVGGFALHGNKIHGTGTAGQPAQIVFYNDTLRVAKVESRNFLLSPTTILAERAAVTLYIEYDSIWHPGLVMRYIHEKRELSAIRTGGGVSGTPFLNTYHNILMHNEAIYWQLDSTFISFQMMRGMSQPRDVRFESIGFFSQVSYDRLQGIGDIHPLSVLAAFARQIGSREFSVSELGRHTRRPANLIISDMMNLQVQGFVSFIEGEDRIILMPKLYHYLAVNARRADHDDIAFYSNALINARLNLEDNLLEIKGVSRVPLSEVRNVVVFPDHQTIRMISNRAFSFDGRVEAGFFTFVGKEFFFSYHEFRVNATNTDSLTLRVRPFENDQARAGNLATVENILENINGVLQIDRLDNRSGRKPLPAFPAFTSKNEGFVFYDQGRIEVGSGTRQNFYFRIDPFTLEGLNNLNPEDISLSGSFVAEGVFPEIHDYLIVQNDYTLGFSANTHPEGIPIYDGLATFSGNISMDRRGIGITGTLNYQGAVLNTRDLQILPDEARGRVNNLEIPQGTQMNNPSVSATNVLVSILPQERSMRIEGIDDPLLIYDKRVRLNGNLTFDANGLSGDGVLRVHQATLNASDFRFYGEAITSQNSDMTASGIQGRTAFSHKGYQANINMNSGTGVFTASSAGSSIRIEGLGITAPNYNYTWNFISGSIEMRSLALFNFPGLSGMSDEDLLNLDFSGHEMVFTARGKDSLKFFAPNVDFNILDNTLNAREVPLIRVADAAIFTKNQSLSVNPDGNIAGFEEARITANSTTRLHRFEQAKVAITSGRRFTAEGFYQYTDNEGFLNPILFRNVRVDHLNRTIAEATIADSIPFQLSDRFNFIGRVAFRSDSSYLNFDGYGHMNLDCNLVPIDWFSMNNPIDPKNVQIRVNSETRNTARRPVNIALMLAGDSLHVYPAFLTRHRLHLDREIIAATGYLSFNESTGDFVVTTRERMYSGAFHQNMISLNAQTCIINADGLVDFGVNLGQLQLLNYGMVSHDPRRQTTELNLAIGAEFFFTERALVSITEGIKTSGSPLLTPDLDRFNKLLHHKSSPAQATAAFSELQASGAFSNFPPSLKHTLFLSDVRLHWNQRLRSFVSTGEIGLFSVAGSQLTRRVNGNLEVRKAREGDSFTLLLRGPDSAGSSLGTGWYFFHKQNNVMAVLSSLLEFNLAVSHLRPSARQMQTPRGATPYAFVLAYEQRPFEFFRRMMQIQDF